MRNEDFRNKLKKAWQFIANPRFLLCFGLAWIITNGWAYIMLGCGIFFDITWMTAVAGTYLAALWLPFTPEKIITIIISMYLLKWIFPKDEKTLGVLNDLIGKFKAKRRERKQKRRIKAMSKKDTEKWLLARGCFVDCRKCEDRKKGCHKDCKFYQSYMKGADNEQREADN